jgi:LemA protein
MVTIFFVIVLGILLIMGIQTYNGLVRLKNDVQRAWSNIDVILKQRFDEIPQLVQVLEQFAQYESSVIQKLVDARTRYGSANSVPEKIQASNEMSLALKGVLAIGEAYPDLKSNNNFMHLQSRVSGLESTISDRRELYNQTVANFNTRIEQFPDVFAARILNYQTQELFSVNETERERPSLKMNIPNMK